MQLLQRQAPLVQICPDLQRLLQAKVGDHVDRVELNDIGKVDRLGIAADDVTHVDQMFAHLAVERCPDFSVAEVELRDCHLGLGGCDVGLGARLLESPVIDIDLGGGISLQQRSVANHFGLRVEQRGLLPLQLCLRLLQLRLVLVLLDGKEQIALSHQRAVLEVDFVEKADNTSNEFDLVDGGRIAGHFQKIADGLGSRSHHRDGWRR